MKKIRFSLIGAISSLFFSFIVYLALFGIFHLEEQCDWEIKTIAVSLNLFIVIAFFVVRPLLASKITPPLSMATSFVTCLYTIVELAILAIFFKSEYLMVFLVLELLFLLIYFIVVSLFINCGLKNRSYKE